MKTGATYNLFDGEELLEGSIKCIRDKIDYINVVYQEISNFGQKNDPQIIQFLKKLKNEGLIDEIYLVKPNLYITPDHNEISKRNIGLELCRKQNCDYVMLMDTDEYYTQESLDILLKECEQNNIDAGYCKMYTYYKTKEYILDPIENYYVPVIYKLHADTKLILNNPSHVLVDPTRRSNTISKCKIFGPEVMMHHMSYIRNDIRKKLMNSSARINFDEHINNLVSYYEKWSPGDEAVIAGYPPQIYKTKKVEYWLR